MISIIVSSYQQHYLDAFRKNVAESIGVPYEIIVVENNNAMSLCQAYNLGVQQAQYDIICFSHEDLIIQTLNWGKTVAGLFDADSSLGLLGTAGGTYKTLMPSHWSFPGARLDTFCVNIYQEYKHENKPAFHFYYNARQEALAYVATIDGVWFCTRKNIITAIPFDDKTFSSFHAYDVDISLAIGRHYKVAVTYDIAIHHFSEGKFSQDWISETLKLHQKWQAYLPVNVEGLSPQQRQQEEQKAFLHFSMLMLDNKYTFTQIMELFRLQNEQVRFSITTQMKLLVKLIIHKIKTRNIK